MREFIFIFIFFVLAIAQNNQEVYSFGDNSFGQLGQTVPFPNSNYQNGDVFQQTASGSSHVLLLNTSGKVYSFGLNIVGQLGLGDVNNRNTPTLIPINDVITQVAAGFYFSLLLNSTGSVYSFGQNWNGQCGFDPTVFLFLSSPTLMPNLNNTIIKVAAGNSHTVLLTSSNTVIVLGNGFNGQLGLGNNLNYTTPQIIPFLRNIVDIAAGDSHTVLLTSTGQVLTMGDNTFGQLGTSDNLQRTFPTTILNVNSWASISTGSTSFHTILVSTNGIFYSFGNNLFGQLGLSDNINRNAPTPINVKNAVKSSLGPYHSLLYTVDQFNNSQVLGTGYNNNGELGLGDYIQRSTPIVIVWALQNPVSFIGPGYAWTNFISQGKWFITGGNSGQLFLGPTTIFSLPNSNLSFVRGGLQSSIITSNQNTYFTGQNAFGQLPFLENRNVLLNRFNPGLLDSISNVTFISPGLEHTLFLTSNKQVLGIGNNLFFQLGNGGNVQTPLNQPTLMTASWIAIGAEITAISSGIAHNLLLTNTSQVYSNGFASLGQLGIGITPPAYPFPILISSFTNVTNVYCGGNFSIILTKDASLNEAIFVFGSNKLGQLGLGDTINRPIPFRLPFPDKILQISAGTYSTLFLTQKNQVWGFGGNDVGQLGLGDLINRVLPTLINIQNITQVSMGYFHSLYLTNTRQVYSTGYNAAGQLGLGDQIIRLNATLIPNLNNAISIEAKAHSLIVGLCPPQYSGTNCSAPICFGISGNNQLVCSSQGTCTSPNTCKCNPPSSGIRCEVNEFHWKGFSGDWTNNNLWTVRSNQILINTIAYPALPGDIVFFDQPGNYTVTINSQTIIVSSIQVGAVGSFPNLIFNQCNLTIPLMTSTSGSTINFINSTLTIPSVALSGITTFVNTQISGSYVFNTMSDTTFNSSTISSASLFTNGVSRYLGTSNIQQSTILNNGAINFPLNSIVMFSGSTLLNPGLINHNGFISSNSFSNAISSIDNSGSFFAFSQIGSSVTANIPILNRNYFQVSGAGSTYLLQYSQTNNSNLYLINVTLFVSTPLSISGGNVFLSGSITTSLFSFSSPNSFMKFLSPLTVFGNMNLMASTSLFLYINGTDPSQINNFNVTGSLVIDSFMIIKVGKNVQPAAGNRFQFSTCTNITSNTQNIILIGAPYQNAKYVFQNGKAFFEIGNSYGSVSNAGYKCAYLGNQKTLEMNLYSKQNIIFLTLTTPIRANNVGFGFDLNGNISNSILALVDSNNGVTQFNHDITINNPLYIDSQSSVSGTIFKIGPSYLSINILIQLSALTNQTKIYYAEIINTTRTASHYKETFPFKILSGPNTLNQNTKDCTNFLQPSRSEIYSLGVFITLLSVYAALFVLCIIFGRYKPLSSRGISPHLTLFFLFVQLILELKNLYEVPFFQGSLCLYYAYGISPLQIISFIMIFLYFIRYFAIINLNRNKSNLYKQMSGGEIKISKFQKFESIILKIISSIWFGIGLIVISYLSIVGLFTIILAGFSYVCQFSTLLAINIITSLELITIYSLILIVLVWDICVNYRLLIKCKLIQYAIFKDPYYFRAQIILFLPFMIFSLISQIVLLFSSLDYVSVIANHNSNIIISTIIFNILLVVDVIFPLVLTFFELFKGYYFKPQKMDPITNMLNTPDIEAMFIVYCESEFSLENILCYKEIQAYKKSKSEPKAKSIIENYLSGAQSPLEININLAVTNQVRLEFKGLELKDSLFETVENITFTNLSDTWFRFQAQPAYKNYIKKESETQGLIENKN